MFSNRWSVLSGQFCQDDIYITQLLNKIHWNVVTCNLYKIVVPAVNEHATGILKNVCIALWDHTQRLILRL